MRTHQLYLDHVRAKIKELQEFEQLLEQALTKECEDILEDENRAIFITYEKLIGSDEEIDDGAQLNNPEEIHELLEEIYAKMEVKKAPRN
jgi:hypothetical protein